MNGREGTGNTHWKTLTLDVEYYQRFLDDTDIPEDQKREFIETLWNIVVQFIDLGFGIHPLEQSGVLDSEVEQLARNPAVIRMIAETAGENADNPTQTGKLEEAWPDRTGYE